MRGFVAVIAVVFAVAGWVGAQLSTAPTAPQFCSGSTCPVTVSSSLGFATADHDTSVVSPGMKLVVTANGTTFKPPGVTFADAAYNNCTANGALTEIDCTIPPLQLNDPHVHKYTVTLKNAFPADPYVVNN